MDNPIKASFERNNQRIREESLEMGRAEGRAEGEGMLHRLIKAMKDAGKDLDFIVKETEDFAKLPQLFKQYGITV